MSDDVPGIPPGTAPGAALPATAGDAATSAVDGAAAASRGVLGRGSLYTLGTAAPPLANALVVPVVTRLLGRAEYGVVATAVVVLQVGMILFGLGLAASITRHGILEASGVRGARGLVIRGALLTAALVAVAELTGPLWSPVAGVGWGAAMAWTTAAAGGYALVVNVQAYLRVLDRPLPFVLLAAAGAFGGPVVGLVLLRVTSGGGAHPGAATYLLGVLVAYLLTAVAGILLVRLGGPARLAPGDLRRALGIGLPTVPHQVALYLASGILVLLATHLDGLSAAGRLQIAVLVGSSPGVLTSSLNNSWAPVVYRTPPHLRAAVLERTARDIAGLAAMLAGGVALFAPWLLPVLAPASYRPVELLPAMAVIAAGTVVSVAYLANVHLVFASGRSAGLAVVTPVSLLIGVVTAYLLGRELGLTGIAVGFLVTYSALALGTAVLRRRVSPTGWRETRLLAPLAAGLGLCLLGGWLPTDGIGALVRLGLLAGCALLALLLLRTIVRR